MRISFDGFYGFGVVAFGDAKHLLTVAQQLWFTSPLCAGFVASVLVLRLALEQLWTSEKFLPKQKPSPQLFSLGKGFGFF